MDNMLLDIGKPVGAVYAILNICARMTATPKDNEIVSALGRILNAIFLKSKVVIENHQSQEESS